MTRPKQDFEKNIINLLSQTWVEKRFRKKCYREILSRKYLIEKILISKVYRDLSFCEKFKFSKKTSFFDKTFRESDDFEKYSSKNDFEKIISKKLSLNNIYRKHKFLDKLIKDCDNSQVSRKILVQESNRIFWSYTYVSLAKNFSNDSGLSPR